LTNEGHRLYLALVDPITVVAKFRGLTGAARSGTRELLATWHETLRRSEQGADVVLQLIQGRYQRTWTVGQKIRSAVTPITVALCSAVRFMTHPTPTRDGAEATIDSLRTDVHDKLISFDPTPLLNELAVAVVADCDMQRAGTTDTAATPPASRQPGDGSELPTTVPSPVASPGNDNALMFLPGGFVYRGVEESLKGKSLDVLKALYQATRKTLTLTDLLKEFWSESTAGPETVRNAISDARKAVRSAVKRANQTGPDDPIPLQNKGESRRGESRTAWKLLDLP
jgi:hypothetical protein